MQNENSDLIKSLNFFKDKSIYNIQELTTWISQNKGLFEEFNKKKFNKINRNGDLPTCSEIKNFTNDYYNDFCKLYNSISYFTDLIKFASITESELNLYENIKEKESELKKWLIRNEKLGTKDLCIFTWDYFDDDEEILEQKYFNITPLPFENIAINLLTHEFKSIIHFCKIFTELYYVRKLYPEGLNRIPDI